MPLTLNVGVSRKVGLPDYGSIGASCNLQLELDAGLLEHDLDGFHARIRDAYVAAHQAVRDELSRLQAPGEVKSVTSPPVAAINKPSNGDHRANGSKHTNGNGTIDKVQTDRPRTRKPATASQVKAILAIARSRGADLVGLLRQDYDLERPEDLSLRQASQLIDLLKAFAEA